MSIVTVFTWTLVRSSELYPLFDHIQDMKEERNLNIHIPVYMIYYCYYNCIWFVQVHVMFFTAQIAAISRSKKNTTTLWLITGPALLNAVLHFEWLGKRATTDIKHVLNLGWYQAVTAITQRKVAMGVDIQQQLVEYARQSWSLLTLQFICYGYRYIIVQQYVCFADMSYVTWLRPCLRKYSAAVNIQDKVNTRYSTQFSSGNKTAYTTMHYSNDIRMSFLIPSVWTR